MFYSNPPEGRIEAIAGCMWSGKTEELIRRLIKCQVAGMKIQVFKPAKDRRFADTQIVSRTGYKLDATPVENSHDLMEKVQPDTQVVAVDEVQFFDPEIVAACEDLANKGKRVLAAGLDTDFEGKTFGPIGDIFCIAEHVTKLSAVCVVCNNPATRSYRIAGGKAQVEIGSEDKYEARCRTCFCKR